LLNGCCQEADVDGTPFGRYRLVELIGHGGMGEVWRAYDPTMDRMVALKVLPQNFAGDQVFKERFRREARAASGLDEPHVVPFHDFGEVDGRLYVTMRLIKGRDLQTVLADGPLSPERAVRIIEQVAKALHAAHEVGLVHRDVKPSNILLDKDDFAYLIDFGIARAAGETGLTSTGAAIGTCAYMSPERLNTGRADARADIYALACVLHEALTGQRPYPGDSLEQQIVGHLTSPPPRPSMLQPGVPEALDAVIAKGMAKQPDQRYASPVELARAARDATTVPLPAPGPTVPVHPSSQPDLPAAGQIHCQDTQLAATRAAPGPPPPLEATPSAQRRMWRRPRVVIPALLAVVVLIGVGVFAAVEVSQRHDNKSTATAAPAAPPNTGPFTGTYTADFGPDTDMGGGTPGSPATVTFTRTGDVDVNSLPDPANQPPRVASPAEALHGRYHLRTTYADGNTHEYDYAVRTECLRTGDRCMSDFHNPESGVPLVFGSGKWTRDEETDAPCPSGGTSHYHFTAVFPLPQPPQDPITLLTGHGHQDQTAPCAGSWDFDDKFVRTGD
jgi:Protein kinase domain